MQSFVIVRRVDGAEQFLQNCEVYDKIPTKWVGERERPFLACRFFDEVLVQKLASHHASKSGGAKIFYEPYEKVAQVLSRVS